MVKRILAFLFVLLVALGLSGSAWAADIPSSKGLSIGGGTDPIGDASIATDKLEYRVGENLKVSFKTTVGAYAAVYYVSDGVGQMIWPRNGISTLVTANKLYTLPDGNYNWTVSGSVGTIDTLVLAVSKVKANLKQNLDFAAMPEFSEGVGSRGLSIGGGEDPVPPIVSNSESIYAQCSYKIISNVKKPTLKITGGVGARFYDNGNDKGLLPAASVAIEFEPGYHQIVVLSPGMKAQLREFTMKVDSTYTWSFQFQTAR